MIEIFVSCASWHGKLLLNNARFVTVTITGQVWECTLALRISLKPKACAIFGWSGLMITNIIITL